MVDPVAPAPVVPPKVADTMSADEKQATQAKKLTDDQRKAQDKAAADARKAEQEKHHADRIKRGQEHNKAMADVLWLGKRAIKIVRKAAPDDIGFMATEACSVVAFVDTGDEKVVQDKDIQTEPSGP